MCVESLGSTHSNVDESEPLTKVNDDNKISERRERKREERESKTNHNEKINFRVGFVNTSGS